MTPDITPEQEVVKAIEAEIEQMTNAQKHRLLTARSEISAILLRFPDGEGFMALSLIGARLAAGMTP